ncbi:MAG: hypothetical protein RSI33_08750 [Clostridia bacterium]
MRKFQSLLLILILVFCASYHLSFAEEEMIELTVPNQMPENYLAFDSIGGLETNGVTFVVSEVYYNEYVLKISVMRLPNDDYTSVVDNQVENTADSTYIEREIEEASQYGSKILGTLCDISTITDANGNDLFEEYKVVGDRHGPSLTDDFYIYFSPETTMDVINVKLIFGVNEDCKYRFPFYDSMSLSIPVLEHASTRAFPIKPIKEADLNITEMLVTKSSSDTNIYLYFNQQVLENISTYFRYELVSICTDNGISSFRLRDQEKDILYDVNIEKGTVILSDENNPKGVTLK